ncbi:hypothetical protein ACTJKT_01045 [Pseudomonas sp. 22526]
MKGERFPEELRIQAVNKMTEKQLSVVDVDARLGVLFHGLSP